LTEEQIVKFRDFMIDITGSAPEEGWQVGISLPNGGWACFPGRSVLYVEAVGFGAYDE
jgi:hypothetical protein